MIDRTGCNNCPVSVVISKLFDMGTHVIVMCTHVHDMGTRDIDAGTHVNDIAAHANGMGSKDNDKPGPGRLGQGPGMELLKCWLRTAPGKFQLGTPTMSTKHPRVHLRQEALLDGKGTDRSIQVGYTFK